VTRCSVIWTSAPRTSKPIAYLFEATPLAGRLFSGDGVSSVVEHALKRANIDAPAKGAHLLRHTAATEMLRNGVPLDQAGLVLRHRSIDMTAYYAKADVALLKQIAQPWPEVKG
jgi:integrase